MSDNTQKTDYHDRTEINQHEPYEVQYWTQKWGITAVQLKEAIAATGNPSVAKVEEYLRLRKAFKNQPSQK